MTCNCKEEPINKLIKSIKSEFFSNQIRWNILASIGGIDIIGIIDTSVNKSIHFMVVFIECYSMFKYESVKKRKWIVKKFWLNHVWKHLA